MTSYKFILFDEFGGPMRKFASKQEATPYMTDGTQLKKLPPQPSQYELAVLLLKEALI